jgi:hypothetical protein
MRWPWWRGQRASAPWPVVNPWRQELETAKEILAEVFGARPSEVEEMIRRRLEERSWSEEGLTVLELGHYRYLEFSVVATPRLLHVFLSMI